MSNEHEFSERSEAEAFAVCERLLETTRDALLTRDYPAFVSAFQLPVTMEAFEGRRVVDTDDCFRRTFDAACNYYAAQHVTDLVRHVVAAAFVGPDDINSTIECRVLAGTRLVQAPFAVHSRMKRVAGDDWRIIETIYLVEDAPRFSRILSIGPGAAHKHMDQPRTI
ncbi:MAG: hypothetical protein AAF566_11495 [Pseudomonadota bacterium]